MRRYSLEVDGSYWTSGAPVFTATFNEFCNHDFILSTSYLPIKVGIYCCAHWDASFQINTKKSLICLQKHGKHDGTIHDFMMPFLREQESKRTEKQAVMGGAKWRTPYDSPQLSGLQLSSWTTFLVCKSAIGAVCTIGRTVASRCPTYRARLCVRRGASGTSNEMSAYMCRRHRLKSGISWKGTNILAWITEFCIR